VEEAQAVVESEEELERLEDENARKTKQRMVDALMHHNPRLQRFDFGYAQIAESMKISEQPAEVLVRSLLGLL